MKKLKYILGLSLIAPAIAFAPVLAAESTSGSGPSIATKAEDQTTFSGSSGTPDKDPTQMKKRLDITKANFKIKLDEATKKRVVLKCKPSQTVVGSTETKDNENGLKRGAIYKNLTDNLQKLIDRLKASGKDTTTLEADQTALITKVTSFNTTLTTYRQTVSDLRLLDCATDPIAFQATLTLARTQRETVRAAALDIRTYLTSTVKPALLALKGTIDDKTKTPTTTGGNQ